MNFFSPNSEKTRERKRTEKNLEKYVYYFEIAFFLDFSLVDFTHSLEVCVFFLHGFIKNVGESNGLYVHFLLSINIRVFLK